MVDNLFFDEDEFELEGPDVEEETIEFGGGKYTSWPLPSYF